MLLRVYVEEVGEPSTGYKTGYTTGYSTGSTSGYTPSYSTGSTSGYTPGYSTGSTSGYTTGYYKNSYNKGYLRPAVDAIISYVDDDLTGTVKTNKYGMASIPVYGCSVSLIVYHKNGNPVYKTVDLFSCTDREEKVVIKVDDACNFNLHFSNTGYGPGDNDGTDGNEKTPCVNCGDLNQLVDFFYKSDDHTGHGEAVAKTTCITAGDDGDNLMVMLKSQYGNMFNVLNITITEYRSAVMALPPQLPDAETYEMVFISNTYETEETVLNNIRNNWILWGENSGNLANNQRFTDKTSHAVETGNMDNDRWALLVLFETSEDDNDMGDEVDLEGNVVVIDCDGNYQTVEHPDMDDTDDYREGMSFMVGCFCNNAPSVKPGDFFPVGKYITGTGTVIQYDANCKEICDDNPSKVW